jgi:hypothetical protein
MEEECGEIRGIRDKVAFAFDQTAQLRRELRVQFGFCGCL